MCIIRELLRVLVGNCSTDGRSTHGFGGDKKAESGLLSEELHPRIYELLVKT